MISFAVILCGLHVLVFGGGGGLEVCKGRVEEGEVGFGEVGMGVWVGFFVEVRVWGGREGH